MDADEGSDLLFPIAVATSNQFWGEIVSFSTLIYHLSKRIANDNADFTRLNSNDPATFGKNLVSNFEFTTFK